MPFTDDILLTFIPNEVGISTVCSSGCMAEKVVYQTAQVIILAVYHLSYLNDNSIMDTVKIVFYRSDNSKRHKAAFCL